MGAFGIRPGTRDSVFEYDFIYKGTEEDRLRASTLVDCINRLECHPHSDKALGPGQEWEEFNYTLVRTLPIHLPPHADVLLPQPAEELHGIAPAPYDLSIRSAYPLPSVVHLADDAFSRLCHSRPTPCAFVSPRRCIKHEVSYVMSCVQCPSPRPPACPGSDCLFS